ncbi:motility associated factor glycosyltransferase family protein [Cohnella massiliensis]|uniref:motility associated factor glycosyltransferase family protein n=1 Tax=Cohnella massiliensis TaxID=1816691 RepID=UPI0009BBA8A7|nr:6-hydroxymethylpterin diphosphokinase MptE-like protein [Cohnella massiliensis]
MTILETNLKFLRQSYPHVYRLLNESPSTSANYRSFVSKDGLGNIEVCFNERKTEFLYDPSQTAMEAARWLQSITEHVSQQEHILIYGLGLGHHLQLLLTYYPQKWVYVYEPDLEMFRKAIETEDLSLLLSHQNVKALAVGKSAEAKRQLIYPICTHAQGSCSFLCLPYYERVASSDLRDFRQEIPSIVSEFNVNQNTLVQFKEQWLRNRLNHISTNLSSIPLHALKGLFQNIPVIIVGSGPSLKEDVEWIRRLRDHCLIFAAGTSVQPLLHFGIEPHLVVMVDGGSIVELVFQDEASRNVPMLYSPTTNFRVTDLMTSQLFHFYDHTDQVSKHYMELTDEDPVFYSSASVTGMAIQAAVYMGCKEIIFAGQDFSFPGNNYYAPGVTHFAEQGQKYVVSNAQDEVENVLGTTNRTTSSYRVLLRNTEEIISRLPGVRFINTSSVGAKIAGTEWKRMEMYYEEINGGLITAPKCISDVLKVNARYSTERVASILTKIKSIQVDLGVYQQKFHEIKKLIGKLAEWSRTNPNKCAKTLESIEDHWAAVVNRESFRALYESLLPQELHYFDSHLSSIVAEKTIIGKARMFETYVGKIVNEMLEVTPLLKEIAVEAISRLKQHESEDAEVKG